jgi:hypothetical protein
VCNFKKYNRDVGQNEELSKACDRNDAVLNMKTSLIETQEANQKRMTRERADVLKISLQLLKIEIAKSGDKVY